MPNDRKRKGLCPDEPFSTCNRCEVVKPREAFNKRSLSTNGLTTRCKACLYEIRQQPEVREYNARNREWHKRPENRHRRSVYRQNYEAKESNRAVRRRGNQRWRKHKRETDENYVLGNRLRTRLTHAIRNGCKAGSAVEDLGCSLPHLKVYLESQFAPGMSWDNYGIRKGCWNVDHIMPLSRVNLADRQQFILANHYLNLRPMWASDNVVKGAKIPEVAL